jgi:hypothetical protein
MHRCVQGLPRLATTNDFHQGRRKRRSRSPTCACVRNSLRSKSALAPFDGFDKAVFLLEVLRNHILHSLIKRTALLARSLYELLLRVGTEMYFHAFKLRENRPLGNVASCSASSLLDRRKTRIISNSDKTPPTSPRHQNTAARVALFHWPWSDARSASVAIHEEFQKID